MTAVTFADAWVRSHGTDTPWGRFEWAWDHVVTECRSEGIPVDVVAFIESGAAGRRLNGEPAPSEYHVLTGAAS